VKLVMANAGDVKTAPALRQGGETLESNTSRLHKNDSVWFKKEKERNRKRAARSIPGIERVTKVRGWGG